MPSYNSLKTNPSRANIVKSADELRSLRLAATDSLRVAFDVQAKAVPDKPTPEEQKSVDALIANVEKLPLEYQRSLYENARKSFNSVGTLLDKTAAEKISEIDTEIVIQEQNEKLKFEREHPLQTALGKTVNRMRDVISDPLGDKPRQADYFRVSELKDAASNAMAKAWAFAEIPPGHPNERLSVEDFVKKTEALPLDVQRHLYKQAAEGLRGDGVLRDIQPRGDSLLFKTSSEKFSEVKIKIQNEKRQYEQKHPVRAALGIIPQSPYRNMTLNY